VKITILVEGKTERAFMPQLREFLKNRLAGRMPNIDPFPCDGRVYKGPKLRRTVEDLLTRRPASDAVIALTDVYTGTGDFRDAADAKQKMCEWVGANDRFYPHAAQHDFEAWLLPFWADIQRLAGSNRGAPSGKPESVDHTKPPSKRIAEVFEAGSRGRSYSKPREAALILQGKDLTVAANQCPELKAFLNTILTLSGAEPL
jgi:hypothetical protein